MDADSDSSSKQVGKEFGHDASSPKNIDNITKRELKVVAPYLWERRNKYKKTSSDSEDFRNAIVMEDFSLDLVDIAQLPQRMLNTANLLKQLTKSNGVKLYLVDKIYREIYFFSNDEIDSGHRISWKIRTGHTIAAHVAFSNESVMANGLFSDDRYPDGTGWGDPTLTSVICVPVITRNAECSAVIELFRDNAIEYVQLNLDLVVVVCCWMGSAIEQQQKRIVLERREDINSKLMSAMQRFISNTNLFDDVLTEILNAAKTSISAQRGSFYLLNKGTGELETKIYDETISGTSVVLKKLSKKIKGIAYMAVVESKLINIADAYTDPRFDKTTDQKAGFLTRSVMCMPIVDHDGCTGVLQIINKLPGGEFSETDEDMFRIFGTYCANIVNYKNQFEIGTKEVNFNKVYTTLMQDRVFEMIAMPDPPSEPIEMPVDFHSFLWYPYPHFMDEMTRLSFFMLNDIMGEKYFDQRALFFFITSVSKMYRNIDFHNFEHAFAFMHTVYCILKRNSDRFNAITKLSLMLGGLCHDLDHPGYTNVFLKTIKDPLSLLYDDSILENHHTFVGRMLINKTKVLSMLDKDSTALFFKKFSENIIATDLKLYLLDHRLALDTICRTSSFDWQNDKHLMLLNKLLMTTGDMTGLAKNFVVSERIAENVFKEFYHQGDREKAIGQLPLPTMDRTLAHKLPEWQLNFIRVVSIPCFDLIRNILPNTGQLYNSSKLLKKSWTEIIDARGKETWNPQNSLPR